MKGIRRWKPGPRTRAWTPTSLRSATVRPSGICLPNQRRSRTMIWLPLAMVKDFREDKNCGDPT